MISMKVLIIGGNGLIGGAVVRASVESGREVYVFGRHGCSFVDDNVHFIKGDWYDDKTALKTVECTDYDVIIDTLIFNEMQLRRTAAIVNGHCRHFVYISTDSVYEHPSLGITEDKIIDANVKWKYGVDKRKAELYLQDHSEDYSFAWTIIRPTFTFGLSRLPVGFPGKRNTFDLCERIKSGKPVIRFDDPKTKHAMCHESVFGVAANALFLNPKAYGQTYHISDDVAYTYGEVFDVLEKALGCEGDYVFLSADVLKDDFKDLYEDMIYDKNPEFTLDNSKIKAACPGVSFHVELSEVIKSITDNLRLFRGVDKNISDYDLMTDFLLIISGKDEIKDYVSGLTDDYINNVKCYGKREKRRLKCQKIRAKLGLIKRRIHL